MESQDMEWQPSVSEDILLHEILPKLPTKSVDSFKCVSKTWSSLIAQHSRLIEKPGSIVRGWCNELFFLGHNESNLVQIDTSYVYKKHPGKVVLIGSCNGVVCLKLVYFDRTHHLVLWNPATREVNHLPSREGCSVEDCWVIGYGLGFDARSGDHKVVRVQDCFTSVKAQIFSKKSGSWRDLKPFTRVPDTTLPLNSGLTVDGAIYWHADPFSVLSFDVSKEEFREFEGPLSGLTDPSIINELYFHFELINWKGSLGVVFLEPDAAEIHVWLKNKDSDNSDSGWTKISTLQPSLGPLSFGRVFNGHIINISYRDNSGEEKVILYNLLTEEKRELGCLENFWRFDFCDHLIL